MLYKYNIIQNEQDEKGCGGKDSTVPNVLMKRTTVLSAFPDS